MASAATVNNLDLEVTSPSGTIYRGNVFDTTAGFSLAGGAFDTINNVESVRLSAPQVGTWSVRIRGTAVNQGRQGFALVATGAIDPTAGGTVSYHSHAVDDGAPLGNGDGVIDPGETVTVPVTLRNLRSSAASTVEADIETSTPGVVSTTVHANYPDIPPSSLGTSLPPHFQIAVDSDTPCGQEIPVELVASHSGGTDESSFSLRVGQQLLSLSSTGLPAPVAPTATVVATVQVTEPITVGAVNAAVSLTHGNIGELLVTLRSPAGTTIVLHNGTDFGVANLNTVYDTLTAPDGPGSMDSFDGQPAAGTWQLTVRDTIGSAVPAGSLDGFTLLLEPAGGASCHPFACNEPLPGEVSPLAVDVQEREDLVFTWPAVPGAVEYRIWQSTGPEGEGETLLQATTANGHVVPGGRFAGPSLYYLVRAVNSCQGEGP
jgi:subtilisin-like proprotein convertase family protein